MVGMDCSSMASLDVVADAVETVSGGITGAAAAESLIPALTDAGGIPPLDRFRTEVVERALERPVVIEALLLQRAAVYRAEEECKVLKEAEGPVVALAKASTGLAECGRALKAARRGVRDADRIAELESAVRAHAAAAAAAELRINHIAGGSASTLVGAAAGGMDSARRELGRLAAAAELNLEAARRALHTAEAGSGGSSRG